VIAETPIEKIVSGGQTGADRAALDYAVASGIPHDGWCPKARKSEDGPIGPRYALAETPRADYLQRTEWTVRDTDGTVVFTVAAKLTGGSKRTAEFAARHSKPFIHLSYHFRFTAPATATAGELEAFLKKVERLASKLGFAQTTVLNLAFDNPERRKFSRRLGGGSTWNTSGGEVTLFTNGIPAQAVVANLVFSQAGFGADRMAQGDLTEAEGDALLKAVRTLASSKLLVVEDGLTWKQNQPPIPQTAKSIALSWDA
jgi:hypothetical protein